MRISEIFSTIQGEGPRVGSLTTFIRGGGCNLRCPGWGCDTLYSVLPEYSDQWGQMTPQQVMEEVLKYPGHHICLTGGEPLTQRSSDLEKLVGDLISSGYSIDLFTNGTQTLPSWTRSPAVTVVMDFKTPSSGEYNPTLTREVYEDLQYKDALKFVIDPDHEPDVTTLVEEIEELRRTKWDPPQVYVGTVWGKSTPKVVELIQRLDLPVKLNVQTHAYIFPKGTDGTSDRNNQTEEVSVEMATKETK